MPNVDFQTEVEMVFDKWGVLLPPHLALQIAQLHVPDVEPNPEVDDHNSTQHP